MNCEDLKVGLRVRFTDGVMKGRTGSIDSFGVMQTLAGTERHAVIVNIDNSQIRYGTNAEWLEPLVEN